ncbi:hypothetical protein Scep_011564 [Stephania cephalantha]|uniref:Uncharacterized protein n=1 Tax=Stephania cephalantha TaxID=152367 RepID=A0AAP0JDB0_9MAGN
MRNQSASTSRCKVSMNHFHNGDDGQKEVEPVLEQRYFGSPDIREQELMDLEVSRQEEVEPPKNKTMEQFNMKK